MSTKTAPTFLTIPTELRNAIYSYIFTPDPEQEEEILIYDTPNDPIIPQSKLQQPSRCSSRQLSFLQTCRQIHDEAHLLALSLTNFHVTGETSYPESFTLRTSALRPTKLRALRHITLTSRISYLRAMNETWQGLPFRNPHLDLDTLTIIPTRANCTHTSYREVADLSQSHTLAYIFAETLKGLRNVRVVEVRNRGCFNPVVWRLVYRSLVYRMWRWAGGRCGVRFRCSGEQEEEGWFRVWLREGEEEGSEVGDEVARMVGGSGEIPDPAAVGF